MSSPRGASRKSSRQLLAAVVSAELPTVASARAGFVGIRPSQQPKSERGKTAPTIEFQQLQESFVVRRSAIGTSIAIPADEISFPSCGWSSMSPLQTRRPLKANHLLANSAPAPTQGASLKKISRRRFLGAAGLGLAAAGLPGCGSESGSKADPALPTKGAESRDIRFGTPCGCAITWRQAALIPRPTSASSPCRRRK